ncbi:MAG: MerR family DNA-binding transcriptional regulator [Alteromonas sp.]|jgi:DNA-binding transcriptional MerR regulator
MKILDFGLVSISQAAKHFGVSVPTLRRWNKEGRLKTSQQNTGQSSSI